MNNNFEIYINLANKLQNEFDRRGVHVQQTATVQRDFPQQVNYKGYNFVLGQSLEMRIGCSP